MSVFERKSVDYFSCFSQYEDVPGFTVSREELRELAKYWAKKGILHDYSDYQCLPEFCGDSFIDCFRPDPVSGCAWLRVADLEQVLGKETVKAIKEKVYEEVREEIERRDKSDGRETDPAEWNVFRNGTQEEVQAMKEKKWAAFNKLCAEHPGDRYLWR